jgi:hypothetical protein
MITLVVGAGRISTVSAINPSVFPLGMPPQVRMFKGNWGKL